MPRCAGRKEDGSPCERIVGASQPYCYSHDPKRAAERQRNADPTIDEDLKKWTGEGRYARLEGKLEEMERELVREALTAWSGFSRFGAREMGLEAKDLVEALASPFAEGVRDLEELSARQEVEADAEGVEEYLAIMTVAWRRELESA